jgi:polyisoprenoid-binding protein YceI
MDSIDFGHDKMNEHAKDAKMFNVAKFPTAVYEGTLVFKGDLPVQVKGDLTLLGVKKPVVLDIQSFKCMTHPFFNKEVCGADARGSFNRADFGLTYGLPMFKPDVKIAIQVEALAKDTAENNPSK